MKYILFNPNSGNGSGKQKTEEFLMNSQNNATVVDMTEISDYNEFFSNILAEDEIMICGGDGTLNRFVNDTKNIEITNNIYYFPVGTGNDFYADIKTGDDIAPVLINEYLKNLPVVTVSGNEYNFINGIGYGIDGYCCEVGDKLHSKGKKANYTLIAIKGLLFHFKPKNATVIIDGKERKYQKVWIAPTMHGRKYGGGMMPTPNQDRFDNDGKVSLMVFYGSSKLKTLMIFPSIFSGKHIKHTECIDVIKGNNITVKFDKPCALQIDGETVLNVTEYTVSSVKNQ